MLSMRTLLVAVGVALLPFHLRAAEPAPEAATLMTERGKLLYSNELTQPLSKDWRAAKGKWEIVDGTLKAAELKADKHGAVARHELPVQNAIIQYSFKLDGARQTSLSINDAKGHCCRVVITPTGFAVRKDSHDHNVADKAIELDKRSLPLVPGEWHTLVLELSGKEIVASIDGRAVALGAHESIDVKKANFGLTVAGESVAFKNLRVWEALPGKNWEAVRTKLLRAREK